MSSIGTGYDLSASQFSPDGRVFQVEYAQKAVENSGTSIALKGKDGVVFAVEKLVTSKLYENGANRRIFSVDTHIGMVKYSYSIHKINNQKFQSSKWSFLLTFYYRLNVGKVIILTYVITQAVAGLLADSRQIFETARKEASNYRSEYGNNIPVKYLADRVAMYKHAYTLYSSVRPFGCSIALGSYDDIDGPQLFMVDPSGVTFGYYGCAMGKARQAAKTEMEKLKLADMSCMELIKEAAKIIYLVHDEVKDKHFELELSWVGSITGGKHQKVPQEVYTEAERYARSALEEDSDSGNEDM